MWIIQVNKGTAVLSPTFIRTITVSNKPAVRKIVENQAKSYQSHRNKKEKGIFFFQLIH